MITEIVKSVASPNRETGNNLSPAMTSHLVSCLDLLSANYDGLSAAAAQQAAQFHLLQHVHATLNAASFDERVRFICNNN